ncbi:zinc-binding dehydrogenase [Candidatus Poribacteria bacterium]|nr:zinc-binding dehydrogenase [Candidatus Poribacteria bacterium]
MKTQTIRYGENGGVEIIDVNVSNLQADEVQVQSAACGVCAWDLATFRDGGYAPPGHEGVGYVTKVGSGVPDIEEGMRVASVALGFDGIKNCPAENIYVLPESDISDEYWLVEPVSCVVTGLDTAPLRPADNVAVIGCGFMGLMFVQAMSRFYTNDLIAIDLVEKRLNLAKSLGAELTYNPQEIPASELVSELKARPIDVVFDCSGKGAGLNLATKIVRRGGHINLFGCIREQVTFNGSEWHGGAFNLVSSSPGAKIRDTFPPAIRLLERGHIDLRPLITHIVPLQDYPALLKEATGGDAGGDGSYIKGVVKAV